jgi:hypothetical protein
MKPDHGEARRCIDAVRAAAVGIDDLAGRLQSDGAAAFSTAWAELLDSIRTRTHRNEGDHFQWNSA